MATVPLEWKLSVQGAEEVKTKLNDINNQFDRGEISAKEYAKGLREINRDARSFNASATMQKNIFLATHPAFNQLTRAMSVMNSVARTGLAISNTMNLMWMRQNGESASLATKRHELAAAQRDLNKALRDGDLEGVANATERINIAMAGIAESTNPIKILSDNMTELWIAINAVSSVIGTIKSLFGFSVPAWITSSLVPGFLSIFLNPTAGTNLAFFASQFLDLIPGARELKEAFGEWLRSWADLDGAFLDTIFIEFFNVTVPDAISNAVNWFFAGLDSIKNMFTSTWNAIISITQGAINGIIGGVEYMVNRFIAGINKMISAYNRIARKIGLGQISTIASVSFGRVTIPTIAAANGFDGMVNQPTLFLTGEAGPEHVSVTPSGGSKGGGSGISVIVNVHGSILTEKELFRRVDENLKNELRKRNYRLLQ